MKSTNLLWSSGMSQFIPRSGKALPPLLPSKVFSKFTNLNVDLVHKEDGMVPEKSLFERLMVSKEA